MNLSKPLINLAILETLKTSDFRDEIDLFVPYIAISLSRLREIPFAADDLRVQLKKDFGIDAPLAAVEVLMARAKKRNLIRLENHVYFPVTDNIQPWQDQFNEGAQHVDDSVGLIAQAFVRYAGEHYKKQITEDDATDLIYEFLKDNVGDSALISIKKSAQLSETIKNSKHLTASFIANLHASKSPLWPNFEVVTRAIMLASYLGYANQISGKKDYSKISVYLDTPLIIGLLGYSGDNKSKTILEMLSLLRSFNINVIVFDITLRELEGILDAWKNDLRARNYERFNPKTLDLLRHRKIDYATLETHLTLLEKRIEDHGIKIQRGFKLNEKLNCDVAALEEKIKQEFRGRWVDPRHDADALNRILNTRKGQRIKTLNQEFSLFVTPNNALVDIGQDFFGDLDRSIPYVVTDRWITTMFWFKHPEIFKDLPTRMLVTSAYGTMFADNGFWKKFTDRLESLQSSKAITEEDFVLVRYDADLLLRVHELSVDRGMEFTDKDVFEIVEHVKNKQIQEKDKEIYDLQEKASSEIIQLQSEIVNRTDELESTKQKITKFSNIIGAIVSSFLCVLIFCCVFWASYTGLPIESINNSFIQNYKNSFLAAIALIVTAIFGFMGTLFGWSIVTVHQWIKKKVSEWLFKNLIG